MTGPLLRNGQKIKMWNTDNGMYRVDGGSVSYTHLDVYKRQPYDETSKFNNFILRNKNNAILKIIDAQRTSAKKNGWHWHRPR